MSASAQPAYQKGAPEKYAFYRRRAHAGIEAMTGRILQAVGYPTKRHRDFICALQAAHGGGKDAEIPYTPFRRAHLTLAQYMQVNGTPDSQRKFVYREIVTLKKFTNRTGILLFHVTPGSEEESTEYIDYLTPVADEAMQRALSSPNWKESKQQAIEEAVSWAVEQLPRVDTKPEDNRDPTPQPLDQYEEAQERRLCDGVEKVADEIERRGGDDYEWLKHLSRELLRIAESRKKTAPARRDYASLSYVEEFYAGNSENTDGVSGNKELGDSFDVPDAPPEAKGEGTKLSSPSAESNSKNGDAEIEEEEFIVPDIVPGEGPLGCLEAAISYAARGIPVFPVRPDKRPYTQRGFKDSSTNQKQIEFWWRKWPDAGIGVPTGKASGWLVLDVDPKSGGDASLTVLFDHLGPLPDTLEAKTGSGGTHFFFQYPSDVEIRNSAGKLGEGLDIRGEGGYIIIAPTVHPSGRAYRWTTDHDPAPAPESLIKLLTAKDHQPISTDYRPRAISGAHGPLITEGERNERLFRIGCAIWGKGAASHAADLCNQLLEVNSGRCSPPLPEKEIAQMAAHIATDYPRGIPIEITKTRGREEASI